jgi:hypothetical protein
VRALLLAGLAVTLGLVGTDVARHPAVLADPAAPVYRVSLALVAGAYLAASVLVTRHAGSLGAVFAAVVGALWMVEVWAGNLAPPGSATVVVYRASTASVLVATLVGGLLGGRRRGRLADGVSVGAISGMSSGMLVCAVAVAGGALAAQVSVIDPPTDAGYADALAAGVNHLWIGVGIGSVCGLAGGAVGVALGTPRVRSH